jgi:glutathione peroxidase
MNLKSLKNFSIIAFSISLFSISACNDKSKTAVPSPEPSKVYSSKEIYHYSYKSIDGKSVKLSDYAGKKIMFVNTASQCGNTPQYAKLESLYKTYGSKLVIIGFPCNQFGGQEPGADVTIEEFCTNTYGITFPLSTKIEVSGANQDSIYTWLTQKDFNGVMTTTVEWNFQKYLVDEKGAFITMFPNGMQPDDPKIIEAINK